MKRHAAVFAVLAAIVLSPDLVRATVLTFDIFGSTNASIIPNSYGDRVASPSDATGLYAPGNGFTPNVLTEYRTRAVTAAAPIVDGTSNTIIFGDGSVRFGDGSVRFADGSVRVGDGTTVILADGSVRFVSDGSTGVLGDGTVAFGDGSVRTIPGLAQSGFMRFWSGGFGGLTNIAYPDGFLGNGEVILSADPGFTVLLNSFDLAGTESNRALGLLQIRDGDGNLLWDNLPPTGGALRTIADGTSNTLLFAETPPPLTLRSITDGTSNTIVFGESATGFSTYRPGVRARELHLLFGANGTAGIDNINFDQVATPEPATLALAGIGALAALARRRSRTRT
ncbi:PEP-CTERM sorting domain-containing protein [Fundidesulfovibrio terrae]|uniref:PEP-CTERM sorting domain-containing protein n=1 Tax=Fundidesulfovibrio terrae TaxID=2922866 RepID=UPI001FB041F8|nr:PEP-CTERM sorting domain-containing protein [Fundidesulfovibrio terrae]